MTKPAAPAPPLPAWEETTAEAAAWDRYWGEQDYDTDEENDE